MELVDPRLIIPKGARIGSFKFDIPFKLWTPRIQMWALAIIIFFISISLISRL